VTARSVRCQVHNVGIPFDGGSLKTFATKIQIKETSRSGLQLDADILADQE